MPFFQPPPSLGNQYTADRVLRGYLARVLPGDALASIEPSLSELGELAGGPMWRALLATYGDEPRLTQWDAWGHRVDAIEHVPLWRDFSAPIAAEKGLIATGYERKSGAFSRLHQFALAYLFDPSSGVYTCPLAMTDGAAKTLVVSGNRALLDRALPRLTSRDPRAMWTSGQWMTERTGGSDVGLSETIARPAADGKFALYGTKWFTSAVTSQMALTLARPEGSKAGGGGLALFYVELRDESGALNGIQVNRLKDKLGTRMVPTAELTLDGTLAVPVVGLGDGTKRITPMLAMTRLWNSICAVAGMRRAIALARDYADKRVAFGSTLAQKPLHADTLAGIEAEYQGAFHLVFRIVELLGRDEESGLNEHEAALLRIATPLAKLTTGKQAVAVASEALEAFGGAGYIEDTGLPRLLRDAQVLPIWEGTTNVLSLDVLRALAHGASLATIDREVRSCVSGGLEGACSAPAKAAMAAITHAASWFESTFKSGGPPTIEAGARRFALTLGRTLELAFLVEHASWEEKTGKDARAASAAARRLARNGVDLIVDDESEDDARALMG